jgi:hypothetical protein
MDDYQSIWLGDYWISGKSPVFFCDTNPKCSPITFWKVNISRFSSDSIWSLFA